MKTEGRRGLQTLEPVSLRNHPPPHPSHLRVHFLGFRCLTPSSPDTMSLPLSTIFPTITPTGDKPVQASLLPSPPYLPQFITFPSPRSFPDGAGGKEPACHSRRHKRRRFNPWVGKIPLEEGMATHSNILAWRIPWTEEPGGIQFMGSQRFGHDSGSSHHPSFGPNSSPKVGCLHFSAS